MKALYKLILLVLLAFFCSPAALFADYTLVLKNGGRITVQSYREEGGMIKFRGLGGEIGISKDQIRSILKGSATESPGFRPPGAELTTSAPPSASREEKAKIDAKDAAKEKVQSPEEKLAEERAKEEKEYQSKVKEITEQLKAAKDRYALATKGTSGPDPTLLNTEEAIRARQDDLISRLRDRQYNPAGPSDAGGVKLSTPSPFTGAPPTITELHPSQVTPGPVVDSPLPNYSATEKQLSEMRNHINQLTKERERLIQEMREKNFNTGALFLE
jgi:hypothetical protein